MKVLKPESSHVTHRLVHFGTVHSLSSYLHFVTDDAGESMQRLVFLKPVFRVENGAVVADLQLPEDVSPFSKEFALRCEQVAPRKPASKAKATSQQDCQQMHSGILMWVACSRTSHRLKIYWNHRRTATAGCRDAGSLWILLSSVVPSMYLYAGGWKTVCAFKHFFGFWVLGGGGFRGGGIITNLTLAPLQDLHLHLILRCSIFSCA